MATVGGERERRLQSLRRRMRGALRGEHQATMQVLDAILSRCLHKRIQVVLKGDFTDSECCRLRFGDQRIMMSVVRVNEHAMPCAAKGQYLAANEGLRQW